MALGNGEIVSADSRQVYCGMDLGTGKDLEEYGPVPYHMIDICPAGTKYNLYAYLTDARRAISEIQQRGNRPILCGGTGLYVESLLKGLALPEVPENPDLRASLRGKSLEELTEILAAKKQLHNTTDVDTCARAIRAIEIRTYYEAHPDLDPARASKPIPYAALIGVNIDREERRRRIEERLHSRLQAGMVDEVRRLLDSGIPADDLIYYGLEYKFLTLYATGQISREEMERDLLIAIHQFAKRQMTWFRGMERRGFHIDWIDFDDPDFVAKSLNLIRK